MQKLTWTIRPTRGAQLIRRCPRCAGNAYENSGRFRINANGGKLDVWLIYKCVRCESTWNLEMYSRVSVGAISRPLYERLLAQDEDFALCCGLDRALLLRNGAIADPSSIAFDVIGDLPAQGEWAQIEIECPLPLDIPVARVIAQRAGISSSGVMRMAKAGQIRASFDPRKAHLTRNISFEMMGPKPDGW